MSYNGRYSNNRYSTNSRYSNNDQFRRQRRGNIPRTLRKAPPPPTSNLHAIKNHIVASSTEFVGTTLFLWFAFAWHSTVVYQASQTAKDGGPDSATILYISIGYGFSLLVVAWVFYRQSGSLFNPSVTLTMVLTRTLPFWRGAWLLPSQLLGGICAAALVSCMFPGDIRVVQTTLAPNVSKTQGVFIEAFLTALLTLAILMLAAEKTKATFLAPLGIGLALFVAELAGVYYTGGSLNFARSFGPCVVSGSFPSYFWIYFVGPGVGAVSSAVYYTILKAVKYEEVNPEQDSSGGDFRQESTSSPDYGKGEV